MDATTDVKKAIWRKVPTFGRAVAFMLSKGESEKPSNEGYAEMLSAIEGKLNSRSRAGADA